MKFGENFFKKQGIQREPYSAEEIDEIVKETEDLKRIHLEYKEQLESMEKNSGPYQTIENQQKLVNEKIQINLERVQQDPKLN